MHQKLITIIEKDACNLLRLDTESVFNLKVEYGMAYLEARFEPKVAKEMAGKAQFWMWWRELWAQRDRMLMKNTQVKAWGLNYTYSLGWRDFPEYTETKHILYATSWEFYKGFHDWKQIKYYPNQVLMNSIVQTENV